MLGGSPARLDSGALMSASSSQESAAAPRAPGKPAWKPVKETELSPAERRLITLFWRGCIVKLEKKVRNPHQDGRLDRLIWVHFAVRLSPPAGPALALPGQRLCSLLHRSTSTCCGSEYEQQRLSNIERNKRTLSALGLGDGPSLNSRRKRRQVAEEELDAEEEPEGPRRPRP